MTLSTAQRIEHRRHHEVHPCVAPGCGEQARAAFHVESVMRLAGRNWSAGDFIDLCPPHAYELYQVTDVRSAERLREWAA